MVGVVMLEQAQGGGSLPVIGPASEGRATLPSPEANREGPRGWVKGSERHFGLDPTTKNSIYVYGFGECVLDSAYHIRAACGLI